ncbi:MAG: hypothetical protein OEY97_07820 [Nitrospirota bacterium]|jgi:hypothetical protein|nr:hypothetical protein [Nitrospirota bacterium]
MFGSILTLLSAIADGFGKWFGFLERERDREAGRAEAENEQYREAINRAGTVRDVRDRFDADADERRRVREKYKGNDGDR